MATSGSSALNVFISYASVDRPTVLTMTRALNDRHIETWIDLEGIAAGASYGPEITDGIRNARAVVLMCTSASLASRNVRQEIQLAWKYDRPIVPVLLEQLVFPDDLAYWLEGAQWIDLTTLPGDVWIDRLLDALAKRGIITAPPSSPIQDALPEGEPLPGNLPRSERPPIGRSDELRRLIAQVANSRCVCVTGPGGVGKTTIAISGARAIASRFPGGCWFIDGSADLDATALLRMLASEVSVEERDETPLIQTIATVLSGSPALLVLDNLEQIPNVQAVLAELIAASSQTHLLITSRIPIRTAGATQFPLAGLPTPSSTDHASAAEIAQFPAVALFTERAQAVRPEFNLTDGNAAAVAEICTRLEGLPLAIELAAARSRLLPPATIAQRLDDALSLLGREQGPRSDRQRTLRGTIRWSYDLLTAAEQKCFRHLAIFDGGFTAAAAETVGDDPAAIDHLENLLDHHLIADAGFDELMDSPRFRLQEVVRSFASDELEAFEESGSARSAHGHYFHDLVIEAGPRVRSGSDPLVLSILDHDLPNIRRAIGWAIAGDPVAAVEFADTLWPFWLARGHLGEGLDLIDAVFAGAGNESALATAQLCRARAVLLESRGSLHAALTSWHEATSFARQAGDQALLATALSGIGTASEAVGDYAAAESAYHEALEINRSIGNRRGIASGLHYLASLETLRGQYEKATGWSAEALPIWREIGELLPLSYSIQQAGILAFLQGDFGQAIDLYNETVALAETLGDKLGIGNGLINLGSAQELSGGLDEAWTTLTRARTVLEDLGDAGGVGYADYLLGHIARAQGNPEVAASCLSDALVRLTEVGDLASVALVRETLAGVAIDQQDWNKAALHFAEADQIREQTGAALPASRTDEVTRDRTELVRNQAS